MRIIDLVNSIKSQCNNQMWGNEIKEATTRDKILYGDENQECSGIVVTLFASNEVIEKAGKLGYNFIIVHEALFWNHGDHTDWLVNNEAFKKKKALLDKYQICVWRMHDYIHAGIPFDDGFKDGIFYGLFEELDWNKYSIAENPYYPDYVQIPKTKAKDLAKYLMEKMNITGMKVIGNSDIEVGKVLFPMHIMGDMDNMIIKRIEKNNIDCIVSMEITDFTVAEYIRDAGKCCLAIGHFNVEEPGMKFFAQYLPRLIGNDLPIKFIQSGDAYSYITK